MPELNELGIHERPAVFYVRAEPDDEYNPPPEEPLDPKLIEKEKHEYEFEYEYEEEEDEDDESHYSS
jgi:hypothetical protein